MDGAVAGVELAAGRVQGRVVVGGVLAGQAVVGFAREEKGGGGGRVFPETVEF